MSRNPICLASAPVYRHTVAIAGDLRDPFYGERNSVVIDWWVNYPIAHVAENTCLNYTDFSNWHVPGTGDPPFPFFPEVAAQRQVPTEEVNLWLEKNGLPRIGPKLVNHIYESGTQLFNETFSAKQAERHYYSSADNVCIRSNTVPKYLHDEQEAALEARGAYDLRRQQDQQQRRE